MGSIENWKDIPSYEGYYQVSDLGNVRSLNRQVARSNRIMKLAGRLLTLSTDKDGYQICRLCKESHIKAFKVHRLVAQAFIPNVQNKPQVNHLDGVKANNHVENLEWCTISENQKHAFRTGLNDHSKYRRGAK